MALDIPRTLLRNSGLMPAGKSGGGGGAGPANPYAAGAAGAVGIGGGGGPGGSPSFADALNMTIQSFGGRKGTPWPTWMLNNPNFQIAAFDPTAPQSSTRGFQAVYMGSHTPSHPGVDKPMEPGWDELLKKPQDGIATVEAAKNLPALWDSGEIKKMISAMQSAGFTKVTGFDTMVPVWNKLVDRAASIFTASEGTAKVTPMDALSLYASEVSPGRDQYGHVAKAPPGPKTTTEITRSVADIDEGDAWAALKGNLTGMLGRDPTDDEVRDFTYRMSSLASRNPDITKTVSHVNAAGDTVNRSSHTDPGFGQDDMQREAYDHAQEDPDYGAYQAASTYFNAALSALGPIGNV